MKKSDSEKIREKVFNNKKSNGSELTSILNMTREFSCLGEIIGRDFEVRDKEGELVYTIRQKPMAIKQMRTLIREFVSLKKLDDEREKAMFGNKSNTRKRR